MRSVTRFLVGSADVTRSIPKIADTVNDLKTIIKKFATASQVVEKDITGITASKVKLRRIACDTSIKVSRIAYVYALNIGDQELQGKTKRANMTTYNKYGDDAIGNVLYNVYNVVSPIVTATPNPLEGYGLTLAKVTELKEAIDVFTIATSAPREAVAKRKINNDQLKELVTSGHLTLKKLDGLVAQLEDDNLSFYANYRSVRKLISTGTRYTGIAGSVIDGATMLPLYNVKVTDSTGTYAALTNKKGRYVLRIPVVGTYDLVFSKGGYEDNKGTGTIEEVGTKPRLNVDLTPVSKED